MEITEIALVHCNIVNNAYQQDSRVFCAFVPNKQVGSLLNYGMVQPLEIEKIKNKKHWQICKQ